MAAPGTPAQKRAIGNRASGCTIFVRGGGKELAPYDEPADADKEVTPRPSWRISDGSFIATVPIRPIDVRTTGPNATQNVAAPRAAMDDREDSAAALSSSTSRLALIFGTSGGAGTILAGGASLVVAYAYSTGAGIRFKARWEKAGGVTAFATLAFSSTPTVQSIPIADADITIGGALSWLFGNGDAVVLYDSGTGGSLSIYFVGIAVRTIPDRNLLILERFWGTERVSPPAPPRFGMSPSDYLDLDMGRFRRIITPARYEITSEFFVNTVGYGDDASGTYTGVPNGLIKNFADILKHLAVQYGGLSLATEVENAPGAFGSFVTARQQSPAKQLAAYFGTEISVGQAVEELAEQSACWVYRSRFDGKLHCLIWGPNPAVDYGFTFGKQHLARIKAGRASNREIVNGVRVRYGFDYAAGRFLDETYLTPATSSSAESDDSDAVRMAQCVSSANRYGPNVRQVDANAIRAAAVALDLRNRLFDALHEPPVEVDFETHYAPDLERGRVIAFDSTVDDLLPYPKQGSDGSWAGKKFRVVEVEQSLGPSWGQEIVAVEV